MSDASSGETSSPITPASAAAAVAGSNWNRVPISAEKADRSGEMLFTRKAEGSGVRSAARNAGHSPGGTNPCAA